MSKKHILAITIASILSTGMITATPVFAAHGAVSDKTPVMEHSATGKSDGNTKAEEQDLIKVSDDALLSMRDVRGARLAIFNGHTAQAQTYVDAAVARVDAAVKDAVKYALDIKAPKDDDMYVPYDAGLTVLDTYQETEDKAAAKIKARHIAKANAHLHRGEQKKALETLKLADVDVAISTELLPVKFAKEHIHDAAKLIGEGKYYEANLALKAVDDAAIIQTFGVDGMPETKQDSAKGANS